MTPEDSWVAYLRKIQEFLDSDDCLLNDLTVVSYGRILRLTRYGLLDDSEMAIQCLQSAVEYAESSWYDPSEDDDINAKGFGTIAG